MTHSVHTLESPSESHGGAEKATAVDTIRESLAARASFYRMLSSLYFKELDEAGIEHLQGVQLSSLTLGVPLIDEGLTAMDSYLSRCSKTGRQELAVDFAGSILAAGSYEERRATPYESVFTSETGLLMQEARDDVYRFYCDVNIGVEPSLQTPEDHLSFECEFMATLAEQASAALDRNDLAEAQRLMNIQASFHHTHLENWIDDLCDTLAQCARTRFYRGVAAVTRGFIHEEDIMIADTQEALSDLLPS